MKKLSLKQIEGMENFDPLAVGSGGSGSSGVFLGFDSYYLDQGDLVVSKVSSLTTSQSIVDGELVLSVG